MLTATKISESIFFCFQKCYNTICCEWSQPPAVAEPPSIPQAPSSFTSLSSAARSDDKRGEGKEGWGVGEEEEGEGEEGGERTFLVSPPHH